MWTAKGQLWWRITWSRGEKGRKVFWKESKLCLKCSLQSVLLVKVWRSQWSGKAMSSVKENEAEEAIVEQRERDNSWRRRIRANGFLQLMRRMERNIFIGCRNLCKQGWKDSGKRCDFHIFPFLPSSTKNGPWEHQFDNQSNILYKLEELGSGLVKTCWFFFYKKLCEKGRNLHVCSCIYLFFEVLENLSRENVFTLSLSLNHYSCPLVYNQVESNYILKYNEIQPRLFMWFHL